MRYVFACLLGLVLVGASITALAAEPSPEAIAAADEAFAAAKVLVGQSRYREACAKFAESQRFAPGSGTLLNLGHCYEKIGRTATAWETFLSAASLATDKGKTERAREAKSRAAALEPRLSKLRISVAASARLTGLDVRRDDKPIGDTLFGVPQPVDPGEHAITARAADHQTWSQTVTVPAEPGVTDVNVPKLIPLGKPRAAAVPPPSDPVPEEAEPTEPDDPGKTQRIIGIVMASTAGLAISASAGFGFTALKQRDRSNDPGGCDSANFCSADGMNARDDALTSAHLSTAMIVIGLVLAGAGITIAVTAPNPEADEADEAGLRWRYGAVATADGAHAGVGASW